MEISPERNKKDRSFFGILKKMVVFIEFESAAKKRLAFCQHPKKHLALISL